MFSNLETFVVTNRLMLLSAIDAWYVLLFHTEQISGMMFS